MVITTGLPSSRTIMNSNGSIDFAGESRFFVNYGRQGKNKDINNGDDGYTLVKAIFTIKNTDLVDVLEISYNQSGANSAGSLAGGKYEFTSSAIWSDFKDESIPNGNYEPSGFVFSAGITNTSNNFSETFLPSINNYYLKYQILSQKDNSFEQIDTNGTTTSSEVTTGDFYVDNYGHSSVDKKPTVTLSAAPGIDTSSINGLSINSNTFLFGIPSITKISVNFNYTVNDFASHIIPHSSDGWHSRIRFDNTKNSYELPEQKANNIANTPVNGYNITYSYNIDISSGTFDATTSNTITIDCNVFRSL